MRRLLVATLTTITLVGRTPPAHTDMVLSQGRGGQVTRNADRRQSHRLVGGGGGVEESPAAGESIVTSGSRGHTGFVQTTHRLLGFSAGLRQWREVRLGVEERVGHHQLQPFLILAHTNQRVYGFQETRVTGRASRSARTNWSLNCADTDVMAVAVTNERALGFSTYTGGFLILPGLRRNACCRSTEGRTPWWSASSRTVIFKSQSNGWTEVR